LEYLVFKNYSNIFAVRFSVGSPLIKLKEMYAIVEIAGTQVKVEKDKYYYTPLLEGKDGDKVEFDNVLLVDNDGKVKVGAPSIKGSKVTGKILGHQKGDKVIIFKKKRRKGYKVKNGHRQQFTKVLIEDIK
jgi:large subunit ribosomal protein L21